MSEDQSKCTARSGEYKIAVGELLSQAYLVILVTVFVFFAIFVVRFLKLLYRLKNSAFGAENESLLLPAGSVVPNSNQIQIATVCRFHGALVDDHARDETKIETYLIYLTSVSKPSGRVSTPLPCEQKVR